MRKLDFPFDAGNAGTSLTLCDIAKCLDGDGIDDIEPESALDTPVNAGCNTTEAGSESGGANISLESVPSVPSVVATDKAVSACTLFPRIEVVLLSATEVVSKLAVLILRADDFPDNVKVVGPSLSLCNA